MNIIKGKSALVIGILLIFLAIVLTNPGNIFMPTTFQMFLIALFSVTYFMFAGLVFKEKPKDEREAQILNQSSRLAFIGGTAFLLVAIVIQSFQHNLDNWLVWALVVIVTIKIGSQFYLNRT